MTAVRVVLGDPVTGLELTDPTGPFEVYASSDAGSTDFGNMVPITETVESGLQDGTLVRWLRDDNRTVTIAFGVNGSSLDELARAVEYQVAPLEKIQTLLTIYPPDDSAAPAVFQVWTSKLDATFRDLYEVKGTKRRLYLLTLTTQPGVRSLNPVTSPALAGGGGVPVTLDNGSSAAGWSSALGGSVTSSGTELSFPLAVSGTDVKAFQVTKTISSRNFTTTPYICIDIQVPNTIYGSPATSTRTNCSVNGVIAYWVATVPSPTAGYTRFWFQLSSPPTAGTSVTFNIDFALTTATTVTADNVITQGDPPVLSATSPIRTVSIQGSQRTPGSFRVANCTLLYTAPRIGYRTYDPASVVSGSSLKVTSVPIGGYVIVVSGILQSSSGALNSKVNVTVTTTIVQGTTTKVVKKVFPMVRDQGAGPAIGQMVGTFAVGSVPLPLLEVPMSSTATMTATITVSNGAFSGTPSQWAFWMGKPGDNDHCALSIPKWPVSGTTILPKAYTWFDAPTVDRPYPGVWGGTAADKTDAVNLVGSMERWGDHQFVPGQGTIYVVGGQADLTYYPLWHSWPVALS